MEELLHEATRPYRKAGPYAWHFARGKLRHDPVFLAVLRNGWLPDDGSLLDLGCGRGLLLALLAAARDQFHAGSWPLDYPPPPLRIGLRGIELSDAHVRVARRALDGRAEVIRGDVRSGGFPASSAIVMVDVLLYFDEREQLEVLRHAAAALAPGGVLLLREADAAAGRRFRITRWSEQALEALRGRPGTRLHYRSATQWAGLLESLGFSVRVEPMSAGTPFANVLFYCRKRDREGMRDRAPALCAEARPYPLSLMPQLGPVV